MRDWHRPCLVLDVDRTLCPLRTSTQSYSELKPYPDMVAKVREYCDRGWYIIINTGRQMRTHECNQGRINALTLPMLVNWLDRHQIPFDEIWPDRPWCGFNGVYVDDNTVTPAQFLAETWEQLRARVECQQR